MNADRRGRGKAEAKEKQEAGSALEGEQISGSSGISLSLKGEQIGDGNQVLGRQLNATGSSIFVHQSGVSNLLKVVQQ